jgi:hypothetical protein
VSVSAALSNGKPHFFGENPAEFESCWDRQHLQQDEGQTFLKSRLSIKLSVRMTFGP